MCENDGVAIAKPCLVSLPVNPPLNGVITGISPDKEANDIPLATDSSTPNHELVCSLLPYF